MEVERGADMMKEIPASPTQIAGLRRALAEQDLAQRVAGAYLTALCHGQSIEVAAQLVEVQDDKVIVLVPEESA